MDKYTVFRNDGSIDVNASVANYRSAVEAASVASESARVSIERAVDAIFDEQNNGRVPKGMLIDGVLSRLGVTAKNHGSLTATIENYLRANTSKNQGADGRRLVATKGQRGGISRLRKAEEIVELT